MKSNTLKTVLIAFSVSAMTFVGFQYLQPQSSNENTIKVEHVSQPAAKEVLYTKDTNGDFAPLDFTVTAEHINDAVVHIKSTQLSLQGGQNPYAGRGGQEDLFRQFFGYPRQAPRESQPQVGTGSGVIISNDGYIVTNNHVIDSADDIEVTLHDNRSYKASLIGTDPTTDLALLKIEETALPKVEFANSDDVRVGEWVLAVGNPFNLNSTVTAGIVSAKGRSINIVKEQNAIESFIQTDAAINPGNSGGALVNLKGKLVGINTAIASPTGSYSGYGFAVPANIVNKVINDLRDYGVTQRGYIGVRIRNVDGSLVEEKDLKVNSGVYVDSVTEDGSAAAAGIEAGDVIIGLEDAEITNNPDLLEAIAQRRPGDKVNITIDRNGAKRVFNVVLNNREGNTKILKKEASKMLAVLGAEFEDIDADTAEKLGVNGGVKVTALKAGKLKKQTNMQEGFIITKVDGKSISSIEAFEKYLDRKKGGVMLEGVYEDYPGSYYYAFGM